jgi:hypothetical protein
LVLFAEPRLHGPYAEAAQAIGQEDDITILTLTR